VPAEAFDALRSELSERLAELRDDGGQAIRTEVHIPQTHYRKARGFPPDLMVYFEDLALRAVPTVGTNALIVAENDQGPDSCNHAWDGMFVFAGAPFPALGCREGASLYDLTPTVLGCFGIDPPPHILGRDWSKTSD
jgi:predicted AlkP superfamily phosphohydrolase/phosphomutase